MPRFRIEDVNLSIGWGKRVAPFFVWIGILAAIASPAFAETRTISWGQVSTYTDGTPIETGKTVTYSAYWTTDSGLGSLRTIGSSIAATSATFDPDVQGMPRGGTVYFTVKAFVGTGGEGSGLAPAYPWVVPVVAQATPAPPTPSPSKAPPAPPTGGSIIKK